MRNLHLHINFGSKQIILYMLATIYSLMRFILFYLLHIHSCLSH